VIFVDTGALFALFVPNDADHAAARQWMAANDEPLVTTDYIVDELLTLLRMRGEAARALVAGENIFSGSIARLEWVGPQDIHRAWIIFRSFQDKSWSFTDCVTRVVMERLHISQAFAFDDHFRQFGTIAVVP
jgi:uncharacterized protein